MTSSTAIERYLERHIESGIPQPPARVTPWQHVLVIPAYKESAALVDKLENTLLGPGSTLVILVLNRPESENDIQCNRKLRAAIEKRRNHREEHSDIISLNHCCDLYAHDLEKTNGPSPDAQGVGLARKVGCDIALSWWHLGAIDSSWICSSDADASFPEDYFQRLDSASRSSVAVTFPFVHSGGPDQTANQATLLYELRMHHYVLGLAYADSPYAYHTIGSTLAVTFESYAQVRGFPKRAGGEDFYLLNKIAKTGRVEQLQGQCIQLEARVSTRVPFGTGPAVGKIMQSGPAASQALYYHPLCFFALRGVLATVSKLRKQAVGDLTVLLRQYQLDETLAQASTEALLALGLEKALAHCKKQSKSEAQFLSQFHQWFDGFRTLKFIHALRAKTWQNQTLADSLNTTPRLWPGNCDPAAGPEELLLAIQHHWRWKS